MFKILLIPDVEGFLKVVEHSCGNVFIHLPNSTQCNLKQDHTAKELLRVMKPGKDGLCISLSDPNDAPAFLRYLMEVAHV